MKQKPESRYTPITMDEMLKMAMRFERWRAAPELERLRREVDRLRGEAERLHAENGQLKRLINVLLRPDQQQDRGN